MKKVIFVSAIMMHYRIEFHEKVRSFLMEKDVEYSVAYGQPDPAEAKKEDTASLDWGIEIKNGYFILFGRKLTWQPILRMLRKYDLIILGQENKLVVNYILQILPRSVRPRLAFWGHGRNFQSVTPSNLSETWKRIWVNKVDWWFGYTEETKKYVASLGFPESQITVFNNAIDTKNLASLVENVSGERLEKRKVELGLLGDNICIFVGGLYPEKRLEFLVSSSDFVRQKVPDFELIIVGGGVHYSYLIEMAKSRPWLKVLGPRFGADKAELMKLARLFLMPGLVGLAVLDAGAAGLPIVTTNFPYHSPEISYMENNVNGIVVDSWVCPALFGDAVISLLKNKSRIAEMSLAAKQIALQYTIEAMAKRFSDGVLLALK